MACLCTKFEDYSFISGSHDPFSMLTRAIISKDMKDDAKRNEGWDDSDHSRPLIMSPFDRAHLTLFSLCVVSYL